MGVQAGIWALGQIAMNEISHWCCLTFEGSYRSSGYRGLSVFPCRDSKGKVLFILQYRLRDIDDESDLKSVLVPITKCSDVVINYCPWCGKGLHDYYRNDIDRLARPDLRSILPGLE